MTKEKPNSPIGEDPNEPKPEPERDPLEDSNKTEKTNSAELKPFLDI